MRRRHVFSLLAGCTAVCCFVATTVTQATPQVIAGAKPAAAFATGDDETRNAVMHAPEGHLRPAATEAALRQRIDAAFAAQSVKAAQGKWRQYGNSPGLDNVSGYTPIDATQTVSGRVQDFAYDAVHKRLYAAVGGGGVWMSSNAGQSWHSITDGMPVTNSGSVGYSPAQGGTIINGTGDSGYSYSGLGVWRSLDNGGTWHKSRGVPDGLLTFRITVDPVNPSIIYAATSRGLYRSTDDAATFVNV